MEDEKEIITDGLEPDAFDLAFEAAAGADTEAEPLDAVAPEGDELEVKEPVAKEPEVKEPEVKEPEAKKAVTPDPAVAVAAKAKADQEAADRKAANDAAETERKETARLDAERKAAQEQLTAAEQAAIALADKEFSEVGKAYEARERVLVAKLTNSFEAKLAAVEAKLNQQIAPVANSVSATAFNTAVQQVHPDAFTRVDEITAWVDSKPEFLQQVYNRVLDTGAGGPSATIELISLFKAETGSAQTPEPTAEEKEAAQAAEAAKNKKLQSQEGVRGRSTQKQAAVDPEDFDGAFDKFAATA